jgi:hypothetical protein
MATTAEQVVQACSTAVLQDPNGKKMRNRVKWMEVINAIYLSMNLGRKLCVRAKESKEHWKRSIS